MGNEINKIRELITSGEPGLLFIPERFREQLTGKLVWVPQNVEIRFTAMITDRVIFLVKPEWWDAKKLI